jgi:hypothetical protein
MEQNKFHEKEFFRDGIIFSYSPVVIKTVIAFRCGSHNFNARLFIVEEKPDCSSLILSKIKKNLYFTPQSGG